MSTTPSAISDVTQDPDYPAIAGQVRVGPVRASEWIRRLHELESFVKANGRAPSQRGPSAEARLYGWLKDARKLPVRGEILLRRVPDAAPWSHGASFSRRVQELKVYRDAYGCWPSARARDTTVLHLAQWLNTQRQACRTGAMTARRKQILDSQAPGWNETVQETWERTVQEIATFLSHRGRMPSSSSPEHSERRLARWISDFRRGRNLTPEREAYLDGRLPCWRVDGRTRQKPVAVPESLAA